jgi:hypothetical protein
MIKIWHTDVVGLNTTGGQVLVSAELGGFEGNPGLSVYVWSDANFRVAVTSTVANGATLTANKWHCVGNAPNAHKLYFASISATPDMRIMVTEGQLHGV